MNPWPVILALLRRNLRSTILFTVLVACAVALGVAISSQERALRKGSAHAADKFDLIVAAPGSQTDLLMSIVYLRPVSVELMQPGDVAKLLGDNRPEWTAPIAFGDSYQGFSIVGTTADFVSHLSAGLSDGQIFENENEAVIGAAVPLRIGEHFEPVHGHGPAAILSDGGHGFEISVSGRMRPTGTPWDNAIVVPIEMVWDVHALPDGHAPGDNWIGPPFDPDEIPAVPAVVLGPKTVGDAYGLRNKYRTQTTTAFFPAEILVQLYEVLGDVGRLMRFLALASQALVVAATLAGVLAIMELYRAELAILRALGATRTYVFSVIWCYITQFIMAGAITGLIAGTLTAKLISHYFTAKTGIALTPTIGQQELFLTFGIIATGSLLALLPAWMIYQKPVLTDLR